MAVHKKFVAVVLLALLGMYQLTFSPLSESSLVTSNRQRGDLARSTLFGGVDGSFNIESSNDLGFESDISRGASDAPLWLTASVVGNDDDYTHEVLEDPDYLEVVEPNGVDLDGEKNVEAETETNGEGPLSLHIQFVFNDRRVSLAGLNDRISLFSWLQSLCSIHSATCRILGGRYGAKHFLEPKHSPLNISRDWDRYFDVDQVDFLNNDILLKSQCGECNVITSKDRETNFLDKWGVLFTGPAGGPENKCKCVNIDGYPFGFSKRRSVTSKHERLVKNGER